MTQILILVAGKGTRLRPLTNDKPKCLVEVNGKSIIRHIIDNIENKPDEIFINDGYKSEVLRNVDLGWSTFHISQRILDGSANGIMLAKDYINEDFIVLSGDIVYQKDEINRLLEEENTILYTEMDERLFEYGTLDMDKDRVLYINEKSTEPSSKLVNCGAYHFSKDVFDYIPKTPIDERFNERIITNTINLMIEDGIEFRGVKIDYLNEISYPSDIEIVEKRLNV